jgi:hypothetical protein
MFNFMLNQLMPYIDQKTGVREDANYARVRKQGKNS